MSDPQRQSLIRKLLKTLPGLAISAFFLWRTFRGISYAQIRSLHIVAPAWFAGIVVFSIASYTLRSARWTRMMRSARTPFLTCARVLMTSLAANNILPLRIGDIMRVFTYAPDLGASPSFILSTVILEKFLDIFVLSVLFVLTMADGFSPKVRLGASLAVGVSALGILTLLIGARWLAGPLSRLFARLPRHHLLVKLEHWIILALDCIRQIGLLGTLTLFLFTCSIWSCETVIYLSFARLVGLRLTGLALGFLGTANAVAFVNLSFLIPSSPGGIGPFEAAAQKCLAAHGANPARAALLGLALHVWMLITITGVGGTWFLVHRARRHIRTPLLTEIETLPEELPG